MNYSGDMDLIENFEYKRTEIEKIAISVCFAMILPFLLHFIISDVVTNHIEMLAGPNNKPSKPNVTDDKPRRISKKAKVKKTSNEDYSEIPSDLRYFLSISVGFLILSGLCGLHSNSVILDWIKWPLNVDEDVNEETEDDIFGFNKVYEFYMRSSSKYEEYEKNLSELSEMWTTDDPHADVYQQAEDDLRAMLSSLQEGLHLYEEAMVEMIYRMSIWCCSLGFSMVSMFCFCTFIIKANLPAVKLKVKWTFLLCWSFLYMFMVYLSYCLILVPLLALFMEVDCIILLENLIPDE